MHQATDIVRAVFLNETRIPSPEYHYIVPGAKVGDLITGPGATGPARVVGYGRKNWTGQVKTGSFWKDKVTDTAQTVSSMSDAIKEAFTSDEITKQLYGSSTLLEAIIPIKKGTNMNMTIEDHETELKRLRKAEKSKLKRARVLKQQAKDRERRRQLAFDTLEAIANGNNVRNAQVRMQAARALLRDS